MNITLAPKGSPPDLNSLRTNEIPMNSNRTEKILKVGKVDNNTENFVIKNDSNVSENNEVRLGSSTDPASSTASTLNLGLGLLLFIILI